MVLALEAVDHGVQAHAYQRKQEEDERKFQQVPEIASDEWGDELAHGVLSALK